MKPRSIRFDEKLLEAADKANVDVSEVCRGAVAQAVYGIASFSESELEWVEAALLLRAQACEENGDVYAAKKWRMLRKKVSSYVKR